MGGIAKYQQAFFSPDFAKAHPECAEHVYLLKTLILEQVCIFSFFLFTSPIYVISVYKLENFVKTCFCNFVMFCLVNFATDAHSIQCIVTAWSIGPSWCPTLTSSSPREA